MILTHDTDQYLVTSLVAEAATYRVYICEDATTQQQYLLQIASETEHNGGLDRAAFVLHRLKQVSDSYEAENAAHNADRLHYDRLFPGVVRSFISDEQGGRRINILALKDVDTVTEMVPLSNLQDKDQLRIDPPSSAWIMGRLLKLLSLTHSEGISFQTLAANNVLVNPSRHFVVVLDWSTVRLAQSGEASRADRTNDVARAAHAVLVAIGANHVTGAFPYGNATHETYARLLWEIASSTVSSAERAHSQFYELVDALYGKKFIPFTTMPL